MSVNVRYANGNLRRKNRARLRAMGCECGICHGKYGPIHYNEPSNHMYPLSFVVDEIKPVSRWKEFGYHSAREAAEDWTNLQAAHYFCNALKSNKTITDIEELQRTKEGTKRAKLLTISDGDW